MAKRSELRTIVWMEWRRFEQLYSLSKFLFWPTRCCLDCRRHRWFLSFWRYLRIPMKSFQCPNGVHGTFCCLLLFLLCEYVAGQALYSMLVCPTRTSSSFLVVDACHQWHVFYANDLWRYLFNFNKKK